MTDLHGMIDFFCLVGSELVKTIFALTTVVFLVSFGIDFFNEFLKEPLVSFGMNFFNRFLKGPFEEWKERRLK